MHRSGATGFPRLLLPAGIAGAVLPYLLTPAVVLPVLLLCLVVVRPAPRLTILMVGLLAGALMTSVTLWSTLSNRLTAPTTVRDVSVEVDRCWLGAWASRCLLTPLDSRSGHAGGHWYLRLPPGITPEPLSRWRVNANLEDWAHVKRPNQSSFSVWLLRHRVVATGRITDTLEPLPLANGTETLDRWRRSLRAPELPQPAGGVYRALLTGDRSQLTTAFRERVARTQTQHLLALSGLHIGSIALWAYIGAGMVWRLRPGRCRLIWQRATALVAMAALLATALPSVSLARAFWMAALPGALWLTRRRGSPAQVLLVIGVGMVVADPLIWLDIGAWFSWWATLLLIMGLSVWHHWPVWVRMVAVQCVLGGLLMPIQAGWALPVFLQGFWVNIVLVPWVTLIALPLAFLTAARVPFADTLFVLAIRFWDTVLAVANPPWAFLPLVSPTAVWVLLFAGAALLLIRPRRPTVVMALVAAGCLIVLASASRTPPETMQIDYWQGRSGSMLVLRQNNSRVLAMLPGIRGVRGDSMANLLQRESWRWPRGDWKAVVLPPESGDSVAARLAEQGVTVARWFKPALSDDAVGFSDQAETCAWQSVSLGSFRVTLIPAMERGEPEYCRLLLAGPGLDAPILFAGGGKPETAHRLGRAAGIPKEALWLGGPGNWSMKTRLRRYIRFQQPDCRAGSSGFQRYQVSAAGLSCPQYGHGLLPWLRI